MARTIAPIIAPITMIETMFSAGLEVVFGVYDFRATVCGVDWDARGYPPIGSDSRGMAEDIPRRYYFME
jgi:hypothetical protein